MSRRGWVLFSAMCVIWGIPYLLIKVAVDELAPSTLVLARTGVAAAVLLPVAAYQGHLRPFRGWAVWRPLLGYTVIEICGPFLLLGYAETRLTSSLTGLLIAAVPIVGALIARFSGDQERLGRRRAVGLLLGVAGVAGLVGLDVATDDLVAVLAMAGVVLGYAIGPVVLARRLSHLPGLGVVSLSITLAALFYLPLGVVQAPAAMPSARVLAAVAGLGLICTALAFVLFIKLVAEVGPPRATVITYVNPAVALVLGVLLLDEAFTAVTIAGFGLVLAGCVLATGRSGPGLACEPGLAPEPGVPHEPPPPHRPEPAGRSGLGGRWRRG